MTKTTKGISLLAPLLVAFGLCSCSVGEKTVTGTYRLNNAKNTPATLEIRQDHTYVQRIHRAGLPDVAATGAWALNKFPYIERARNNTFRGKSNYDPHASGTLYLQDAYSVEGCPVCIVTKYDSVALPIERLAGLIILVEDPNQGIGYEKN
jgi:hypothetical protein